ncbi:putative GDP-fucose protein O-fucosyltransferase [Helianthus annuus]|uniref:O-fucosyltransferase family protein n=1 Tax=Helianthus annuus TaxID=4232 RepID=A0A251UC12_HELAN|nr:O-fucosyltransferase 38 [Helianthus annuus]KAF5798139.1 putative GDP-fucose protein O-fucosyltransferase [Helianthus annuus]KAJ0549778.1 putative GDP-fucose protein O-fucosyltransferase [Helianthus annuus]KAJ0556289.1 putative GDP-fucose protein O-fucosyltransferase [Helianthus annuus]KAJ0562732.1 putative GDP-fucose protein O-fucosyltransferase [Helianthus annuus]KAJ0728108.1 putative GDP-fucose protein O-fucosyltransferase [Helianthus annuus]
MRNKRRSDSMVSSRGGGGSSSLCKPSFSTILRFFIVLILFIFIFNFYSRGILEDEQNLNVSQQLPQPHDKLWEAPFSDGLHSCLNPTSKYQALQGGDHYITVRSNGGLNQMRTGIADMVAVSRMMNATLVIPELDKRSFWQDKSIFSDIFDEDHFINSLKRDVRIIKKLPQELDSVPRARKHFTSWGGLGYYEEMTKLWADYQVIHVPKSDSRLANNDLPLDIQRLRCRALYHALRFSPSIETLGKKLVERLRSRGGRYISLHLRYEKDMLAFSGCTYGLSDSESEELRLLRENTNHWKVKKINSTEQRIAGLCPLTPKEVGIFLQALGYPPSTIVYVAAGEIYAHLSDLTSRFPNVLFKELIATEEELKAYSNHASQTAALDYIISLESDVFIPTHSGNMARAVEGHRRLLGHRKTITPDRKGLVEIFDKLESGQLNEGASLQHLVKHLHQKRQGAPRKREGAPDGIRGRARYKAEESFYQNPYPECICRSKHRT